MSQGEMNTDVTSGMENSSVYPKSTRDEPHFPFIGSIAIPCSTAYSTSGFTSLRKLQRFTETRACIQATSGKSDHISSQGISVSTPLEAENSGSLSHTYCSGMALLEVLVESWPTCLIEFWESVLFSRRCGAWSFPRVAVLILIFIST